MLLSFYVSSVSETMAQLYQEIGDEFDDMFLIEYKK